MIGKAEWFESRKYSGWGLSPRTWQGWVYVLAVAAPIAGIQFLPVNGDIKTVAMVIWSVIFAVDFVDLMIHVKRDERDKLHEAIADRNALWFIILALVSGFAYRLTESIAQGKAYFDPIFMIAILGGMVVKAITHWKLDR